MASVGLVVNCVLGGATTSAGVGRGEGEDIAALLNVGIMSGGCYGTAMERLATASGDKNEYGGLTPKATSTTGLNDGTGSGCLS